MNDRSIYYKTHQFSLILTAAEAGKLACRIAMGDGVAFIKSLPEDAYIKSKSGEDLI